VAESFFQLLKREQVKQKIYADRSTARHDICDYIEVFCNPKRRHGSVNGLSPVKYEKRYAVSLQAIYDSRGDSIINFTKS
jgi:putative transposase